MDSTGAAEATPLRHALDGFATAFGHLVKVVDDGALEDLDAEGLVGFLQDFESVRNAMPVVDHAAIRAGIERDLPDRLCQRSMGRVLTQSLRVSAAEAGRRVRAAEQLADRRSMTGEPLAPLRPQLAEAQRRGEVTPEQVSVIDSALRQVDRGFDPAEVEAGEQILVTAARAVGPADLRTLAEKVVEAIDPDGTLPDDQVQQDRRFFHFRRAVDGSFRGEFRLTPQAGAKLTAILDPLAGPRATSFCLGGEGENASAVSLLPCPEPAVGQAAGTAGAGGAASACGPVDPCPEPVEGQAAGGAASACGPVDPCPEPVEGQTSGMAGADGGAAGADGGQPVQRVVEADQRTYGQRLHDALEAVCDRLLRSDALPDSGGTPATVIIDIDADKLRSRTGVGYLSDGSPISAQTVIDLADQADLAWCVKSSKGAVLALGRARRIASPAQTLALIARDGGCSFPGCDIPAEWCERHHIVPWIDGGATDLCNLTLLCGYHHANFAGRGWTCRMTADRLPAWIPPKWIDRHQRPIVHPRIRIRSWRPQDPLPDTDPP